MTDSTSDVRRCPFCKASASLDEYVCKKCKAFWYWDIETLAEQLYAKLKDSDGILAVIADPEAYLKVTGPDREMHWTRLPSGEEQANFAQIVQEISGPVREEKTFMVPQLIPDPDEVVPFGEDPADYPELLETMLPECRYCVHAARLHLSYMSMDGPRYCVNPLPREYFEWNFPGRFDVASIDGEDASSPRMFRRILMQMWIEERLCEIDKDQGLRAVTTEDKRYCHLCPAFDLNMEHDDLLDRIYTTSDTPATVKFVGNKGS